MNWYLSLVYWSYNSQTRIIVKCIIFRGVLDQWSAEKIHGQSAERTHSKCCLHCQHVKQGPHLYKVSEVVVLLKRRSFAPSPSETQMTLLPTPDHTPTKRWRPTNRACVNHFLLLCCCKLEKDASYIALCLNVSFGFSPGTLILCVHFLERDLR